MYYGLRLAGDLAVLAAMVIVALATTLERSIRWLSQSAR